MKAANYLFSLASKDGLELGAVNRLVPTLSIMGSPGATFDSGQFGWLGSPASDTNLCIVSKATPIRTVDDLLNTEVIVGTDGVGSDNGKHVPTALNSVLGTKFKIIDGYNSTGYVLLAIDRGEIQGLCLSAETLTDMRGDLSKTGEWRAILQAGMTEAKRSLALFPTALLFWKAVNRRALACTLPERGLEVDRAVVLAQQVPEGFLGELLKVHHAVAREEVERRPGLIVELYAFARHHLFRPPLPRGPP